MTTVLDTTTVPGVRLLHRLALLLALVSGAFCALFCSILAVNYHGFLSPSSTAVDAQTETLPSSDPSYRKPAEDSFNRLPTDYPSLLALRQALAQDRQNEEIKTQIRHLDHKLRVDYFQRRAVIRQTTLFLFASSILFFAAVRTINVLNRQIPDPGEMRQKNNKKGSIGFAVVVSWLMLCAGLYLGLLFAPPPQFEQMFLAKLTASNPLSASTPLTTPAPSKGGELALPSEGWNLTVPFFGGVGGGFPSLGGTGAVLTEEILAQNWVSFRNFDGNGIGFSDNPPIRWDGKTGDNIVWQAEVPLSGNSSPVIWENKLFLTGADENTQKIFCYDIADGKLLWEKDVTRPEAKVSADKVDADTGFAAPTPVVDGRHVYAMFANGELVAVDLNGNFVWRHSFGIPDNHYGFASSPALYFDKLIVQFDNGDGEDGTSKLVAFDLDTGRIIWETARDMPNSWASPTIKNIGGSYQIITCADPFAIAYNPEDGKEIWRCRCLSGADVGPSAISLGDVVLITNQSPRTTAIDATGSGDITATHILWIGNNALPDTVSPLAAGEYFLTLDAYGYLTGYNPKEVSASNKRAKYWELSVGEMSSFYSSPLRVGEYIYAFDKTKDNARAFVLDISKAAVDGEGMLTDESAAAMIISENPMLEPCVTSPAVLNNRLYIRSAAKIYCIGRQ